MDSQSTWSLRLSSKAKLRGKLHEILQVMDATFYESLVMARFEAKVDEEKARKILEVLRR